MKRNHFFNAVRAALIAVIFSAMAMTVYARGEPEQTAMPSSRNIGKTAVNWTLVTQRGVSDYLESVAFGNGKFIAVGSTGAVTGSKTKIVSSADGITWTALPDNADAGGITFCGGKFFMFGWPGTIVSSTDGVTWNRIDTNARGGIHGLTYGDGKWVFVTYEGQIFYSTDSVTWTETRNRPSGFNFQTIAYGDGRFVAAGNNGRIMYSTDGITWTDAGRCGTAPIRGIAYGAEKFVAAGWGRIFYSGDGVKWTEVEFSGELFDSAVWQVVYGGKFIAQGIANDKMAYSTDGVTWTETKCGLGSLSDIAYGNGRFVVVGSDGDYIQEGSKIGERTSNKGRIAYSNK